MGAFSQKDERRLLRGCLGIAAALLGVAVAIGFGLYSLVAWALS